MFLVQFYHILVEVLKDRRFPHHQLSEPCMEQPTLHILRHTRSTYGLSHFHHSDQFSYQGQPLF